MEQKNAESAKGDSKVGNVHDSVKSSGKIALKFSRLGDFKYTASIYSGSMAIMSGKIMC